MNIGISMSILLIYIKYIPKIAASYGTCSCQLYRLPRLDDKRFANKPIQDCINDGFPSSFLPCQNPQATESSINADVSTSEPGRSYLQATDGLGSVSFPSSYDATVRIGIICNFAPDDELDENGKQALHFQHDTAGNFYCHNEESVQDDADHDVSRRILS